MFSYIDTNGSQFTLALIGVLLSFKVVNVTKGSFILEGGFSYAMLASVAGVVVLWQQHGGLFVVQFSLIQEQVCEYQFKLCDFCFMWARRFQGSPLCVHVGIHESHVFWLQFHQSKQLMSVVSFIQAMVVRLSSILRVGGDWHFKLVIDCNHFPLSTLQGGGWQ